jgi:hypothetical protein
VLLSHVQLYGFQARLRSFGEAKKLNNGGQTLQANATLATSYPRRRSTRVTSACQKRYTLLSGNLRLEYRVERRLLARVRVDRTLSRIRKEVAGPLVADSVPPEVGLEEMSRFGALLGL